MTRATGPAMRGGRALRLRSLVVVALTIVALYLAAIWAYLATVVAPGAGALARETQPVYELLAELNERTALLTDAARLTVPPLPATEADRSSLATQVRALVTRAGERPPATPFARVPLRLRVPFSRADEVGSRLQNVLVEFAAAAELSRPSVAEARHQVVDSLLSSMQSYLGEAREAGLRDLIDRERAFEQVVRRAIVALAVWLLVGLALMLWVFWQVGRRVAQPLQDLDRALTRVAAGDLHVQAPVHRGDELGRLVEHFNETTRVLRERAEQQGQFAAAGELIAGVAHEVNNPLMAIASLAELRLAEPGLPAELRSDLDQIRQQGRRAAKLLAGLLRFARTGEPQEGPVDLNAVIARAVDLLAYRLPVEEVTLDRVLDPALPAAYGDPMRLEQVFVNLLSNALDALRLVPPPRRVEVRTWRTGDRVYAVVSDNGPGVPEAFRGRLFAPFTSSKGTGGTGLGLYISRQIVRSVGGDLVHEPAHGRGASFVVRLVGAAADPLRAVDTAPAAAEPLRPLSQFSVLVVEDEEALRRVVTRFLEKRGAEVVGVADGREALDRLTELRPDVILADLRMPGMGGAALYQWLRREHPESADRILFLSGDLSQLAELGSDHDVPSHRIVAKPIDLAELEERILAVARSGA